MMEKSRLYTVTNMENDEPVTTEAFICSFSDLEVTGIYLDDFVKMSDGTSVKATDLIVKYETAVLKEVKDLIKREPIQKNFKTIIEKFKFDCIYKLLAQKALEELDFITAEQAILKLEDFQELQFLKRIRNLDDKEKQRAWIQVHYQKY